MSYARFSSDDYQCDVYYTYEDSMAGFTTHVAGQRYIFTEPLPPPIAFDPASAEAWVARHQKVSDLVRTATREPIGLPHDGEDFTDATATECAERLVQLRELGYRVPQYAIDALLEEAEEDAR